jgi:hypothetical protein
MADEGRNAFEEKRKTLWLDPLFLIIGCTGRLWYIRAKEGNTGE